MQPLSMIHLKDKQDYKDPIVQQENNEIYGKWFCFQKMWDLKMWDLPIITILKNLNSSVWKKVTYFYIFFTGVGRVGKVFCY